MKDSALFSKIMLGTAQFGMNYGIANTTGKPDKSTVRDILAYAFDNDIRALDTAPEYGNSEEIIGEALQELGLNEKFAVVTKIPKIPSSGNPGQFIRNSVQASLKRLKCNILAAVLLHHEEDEKYFPILRELQNEGLILHAGLSLNTSAFLRKCSSIPVLQIPCSLLDHRFDVLSRRKQGIHFIRGAYLQGMLLMPIQKIFIPEIAGRRQRLEDLGLPMTELALRYLLSLPGQNSILTGVETASQLKENIRAASKGPLPEELMKKIDAITNQPPLPEKMVSPFLWAKYYPAQEKI